MHFPTLLLATLAATTSLASINPDLGATVTLSNQASELASQTIFNPGTRQQQNPIGSTGPYRSVELTMGPGAYSRMTRCQILGLAGEPIVVSRGTSVDVTFGDGGEGAWTLVQGESEVSSIICDPSFRKARPSGVDSSLKSNTITVILSATELGTQTTLPGGKRAEARPVGSAGPYQTVEIRVGAGVEKQDTRCMLLDQAGKPVVAARGENTDITFSDNGKGEWSFGVTSEVGRIICDPAFEAASSST